MEPSITGQYQPPLSIHQFDLLLVIREEIIPSQVNVSLHNQCINTEQLVINGTIPSLVNIRSLHTQSINNGGLGEPTKLVS
jgi:hypothetical protein